MNRITDEDIAQLLTWTSLGERCHLALLEIQSRRKQDAIAVELLTQLKELRDWYKNEYQSNQWIDMRVDCAIQRAEEAGYRK